MKLIVFTLLFSFFGVAYEGRDCSPAIMPFSELLNSYNAKNYMIIEGYFLPAEERRFSSEFMVTRSSHSNIKVGKEYNVSEYGPFGDLCEMYEMQANVDPELTGKKNPRLLILYKQRSKNGKLVTPIFWQSGVNASKNSIVTEEYDYTTGEYVSKKCSTKLDEIWEQILNGNTLKLNWEIE